jgi:hypothetical protein
MLWTNQSRGDNLRKLGGSLGNVPQKFMFLILRYLVMLQISHHQHLFVYHDDGYEGGGRFFFTPSECRRDETNSNHDFESVLMLSHLIIISPPLRSGREIKFIF